MPLYEYECRQCHHRFERIQKFNAPPIRKCPKCRAGGVRKLISSPAVHFKGTGWYITDYGRKGAAASGRGDKDSGGKDAGKPASGTTPADKESGGKAARTGDSAKKPDRKR